jgi:hypothetical protein
MTAVLAAGFVLLAVAAIAGLVPARPSRARAVPYPAGAAGAGCLAVAGGFALSGYTVALNVRPHLRYASDVVDVVETWLYRPVIRLFGAAVAYAKRLKSGRLDAYLLYMLIALIAVIAVVTALA